MKNGAQFSEFLPQILEKQLMEIFSFVLLNNKNHNKLKDIVLFLVKLLFMIIKINLPFFAFLRKNKDSHQKFKLMKLGNHLKVLLNIKNKLNLW